MTEYNYTTATLIESELRAAIPFSTTTSPTLADIEEWIVESSADVNRIAGRVYGSTPYTETYDYSGTEVLVLKNAPLISVTEVAQSLTPLGNSTYALTDVKTENTDFAVYTDEGEIEIISSWSPTYGLKTIKVTYVAGYAEIPKDIQALTTKKVTKRVIDTLLSKDVNEKKSGKSVSVGSISIVKPADFGVAQYKTLSDSINELENSTLTGTGVYRIPLTRY